MESSKDKVAFSPDAYETFPGFENGFVLIDSPELVSRYSERLSELGIAPTDLRQFRIDGLGWSPEVAAEKNDPYYLSLGAANPLAVILTPDQAYKPIFFPYNSYDQSLMQVYYDRFRGEITDITRAEGIGVDIDHELTNYVTPRDLLLVDYVIARSSTGDLTEAAVEQQSILSRLEQEPTCWFDKRWRESLIQSARKHGDLRFRRLFIPDFQFNNIQCFYTRAFGGVFVLPSRTPGERFLVLENKGHPRRDLQGAFYLTEPGLVERLFHEDLVELDLEWYRAYPAMLQHIRECLIADLICADSPDINYLELSPTQKKHYLRTRKGKIPDMLQELERLIKKLSAGERLSIHDLSPELKVSLLQPARRLSKHEIEVISLLLSHLSPLDIRQLYRSDKSTFLQSYASWTPSKQAWSQILLRSNGDSEPPRPIEIQPKAGTIKGAMS